jgi:uncharacterized delta-60 repeat protein
LLSAGALDTTFGNGGEVIAPVSSVLGDFDRGMAVQADGKILVAGLLTSTSGSGKNAVTRSNFAVVRYNVDGTLDSSFSGGTVSTPVGLGDATPWAIAVQNDGKVVVVGSAVYAKKGSNTYGAVAVVRYNSNGTLDSGFGSGGIVLTAGPDVGYAVSIDGSGKIVVGGESAPGDFTLVRYNTGGTLDTTFGSAHTGIVVTPNFGGGEDIAHALAIQPDGNIVLAGDSTSSTTAIAVARYHADGTPDTSFNGNGLVWGLSPAGFTDARGRGVVVQNTGGIVVSGLTYNGTYGTLLVRLVGSGPTAGQVDTTFGGSNTGYALGDPNGPAGTARRIVQAPDGDLLTAGTTGVNNQNATWQADVRAYLPNGTPDTTFGVAGMAAAPHFASGYYEMGWGVAVEPDGKVVLAGKTGPVGGSAAYPCLARFLPPNTKIGSFTATQASAGSPVAFTAWTIMDSNPTATITQVAFYYLDSNNNPVLVNYGTQSSGVWTLSAALTTGSYKFFAVAQDSNGALSDPSPTVTLTVQ